MLRFVDSFQTENPLFLFSSLTETSDPSLRLVVGRFAGTVPATSKSGSARTSSPLRAAAGLWTSACRRYACIEASTPRPTRTT